MSSCPISCACSRLWHAPPQQWLRRRRPDAPLRTPKQPERMYVCISRLGDRLQQSLCRCPPTPCQPFSRIGRIKASPPRDADLRSSTAFRSWRRPSRPRGAGRAHQGHVWPALLRSLLASCPARPMTHPPFSSALLTAHIFWSLSFMLAHPVRISFAYRHWCMAVPRAEVRRSFITTTVREESQVTPQGRHPNA